MTRPSTARQANVGIRRQGQRREPLGETFIHLSVNRWPFMQLPRKVSAYLWHAAHLSLASGAFDISGLCCENAEIAD